MFLITGITIQNADQADQGREIILGLHQKVKHLCKFILKLQHRLKINKNIFWQQERNRIHKNRNLPYKKTQGLGIKNIIMNSPRLSFSDKYFFI